MNSTKSKSLRSALYVGSTTHARQLPMTNRFTYRVYMAYIDLHEAASGQLDCWPIFSTRTSFSLLSLLPRDHMIAHPPFHHQTLLQPLSQVVQNATGDIPKGSVSILTNLRVLGIEFNPVSFYYVFNQPNNTTINENNHTPNLKCVVAEVGNFPWFEQHNYVLVPENDTESTTQLRRFCSHDKQFHVSPFMQIDGIRYDWKISTPGERLQVRIGLSQDDERSFFASLDAERVEWSIWNLLRLQILHPVQALRVMIAILYEAQKLFRRGFTFFPHPNGAESTLSKIVAAGVSFGLKVKESMKSLCRRPVHA